MIIQDTILSLNSVFIPKVKSNLNLRYTRTRCNIGLHAEINLKVFRSCIYKKKNNTIESQKDLTVKRAFKTDETKMQPFTMSDR